MSDDSSPVPDYIEPIIGWRAWNVDRHGRLGSVFRRQIWPYQKAIHARCTLISAKPNWLRIAAMSLVLFLPVFFLSLSVSRRAALLAPAWVLLFVCGCCLSAAAVQHKQHGEVKTVPLASCRCGVYAVKSFTLLAYPYSGKAVIGRVALWGHIIEGQHGWRAERAYPVELYSLRGDNRLEQYGVPVHYFDTNRERDRAIYKGQ